MRVSKSMSIGQLASATECRVPTIRYYEQIGLLPRARRNGGHQRVYEQADLQRLRFIRRCRDFGFSIEQIKELVALAGSPERDCTAARDLTLAHLGTVRAKLKELRALERSMRQFVEDCETQCAGGHARGCVILNDLVAPATLQCLPKSRLASKSCCGSKLR